jgi:tetratricopeptide (TPR) repeat protein
MAATYDAFLSFDPADAAWVERWLLPRLERAGLSIATTFDFALGRPRLINIEQTVAASRHTLLVLSPAWLGSAWSAFEGLLIQTSDPTGLRQRLIPLLHQPCDLPSRIAMLDAADFTGSAQQAERQFERLLRTLAPSARSEASIPLDTVPPVAPLPPGSRMRLPPNPQFVGREEELKTLARLLQAGSTAAIGPIAAATGLGGIGKTQLASEFAHRYGQYFPGGVYWLSLAEADAVPNEVVACGLSGGLDLPEGFATQPLESQIALVLARWQLPIPRLLIFDNCEDEALLAQWRPSSGGCRVLVTSRRSHWDEVADVQLLPLAVLPRVESVALLRAFRPDLAADDPELDAVAAELGDLPLALHLAGSYLKQYQRDMTVTGYLAELRSDQLLAHESLQGINRTVSPTNHPLHVGRTFALSLERLKPKDADDALALDLLARVACFAPGEPIPRDLLLKTVELLDNAAKRRAYRAIARLLNLGLVEEASAHAVRMHRLVVARVVETISANVQAVVERLLTDLGFELLGKGVPAPLRALEAHLRYLTDRAYNRDDVRAANLCTIMGRYLRLVGSYAAARPYVERALAYWEGQGNQPESAIAVCLGDLAELLRDQGDYAAARPLQERALAIRERILGADHSATSVSLNNLALLLQAQGDYAAARPLYERALRITEASLGAEHPDTGIRLNNLAELLRDLGDYTAARPLYERALRITEASLGAEHPDTSIRLNNLANLLKAQGDYTAARPLYERALRIAETSLGAEHPTTGTSLNNLANLLKDLGDYTAARPLYERALAIAEASQGPAHPETGTRLNNLANLLKAQGDYTAARPLYERALAIREASLGPQHPDTALSLWWIALMLNDIGDIHGARERLVRAVAIYTRALGADHPSTRNCQSWLDRLPPPPADPASPES